MPATPLDLDDRLHVEAAQGWLALGDWNEANAELDRVRPEFRAHPDVISVRWRVCALGGQWDVAIELATVLIEALPGDRAENFYELAVFACKLDRVEEARTWIGKAIELGGDATKLRALEDPALAKVWEK